MTAAAGRWPYPGDTPLVRARRLLHSCRALLHTASPDLGRQFDEMAVGFGETWAIPRLVTTTDDDWLSPADAADFLCISVARIRGLRHAGRLNGVKVGNEWQYKVADLRALQTQTRRRAPRLVADH